MKFLYPLLFLFAFVANSQQLSVERIWKSSEFAAKGVQGFTSLNDGEHFTRIVRNQDGTSSLMRYSFKDFKGKGEELVNLSTIAYNGQKLSIDDASLSKSGNNLLLSTNTSSIYRYSFKTIYFVYNLQTKKTVQLFSNDTPQTLATFSPDESQIAFVAGNNLYNYTFNTGETTQLTFDGAQNNIINGTTDWVYEEEFAITQGFAWSPDSKYIAFLKFDESAVKEFSMAMYGELYPENYTFKYPKAGEDNSKVSLHITPSTQAAAQPVNLGNYEYIPRFQWSPIKNQLVAITLNRHQSEINYHLVSNPSIPSSVVFYHEKSSTYLESEFLLFMSDGKSLLHNSDKDGYNHIYQLGFDGQQKQITKGNWEVIDVYGCNDKLKTIYYSSSENGAINKVLYAVSFDGKTKKLISPVTGTNNAEFSVGCNYFVRSSSQANAPATYTLCDKTGKELIVLEDNASLREKLTKLNLPSKEFLQVKGADGTLLNAWMIKPANFDPNKKYPVYFTIYCGPGSNTVLNKWDGANYMYHQLLAEKGYIVFSVDPRGTMYRGAAFKKSTYLQLGKLETEDLIAVARQLQKESYVDPTRIGIQGWSYGGFMTSLAMTKGAAIFKAGIAVAPVTNWRNYDNIYTERFMQTPAENATGYDDNSPVNHADKLKGSFLLIHGSADDNVHYQNTMEFINALVAANKQFDLFIYPNKNHGIYGGNTRNHLFTMLLDFTLKNL
jgi:dipeptidyl-peptidase-4